MKYIKHGDNLYSMRYISNIDIMHWEKSSELRFFNSNYVKWFSIQSDRKDIEEKYLDVRNFISNPSRVLLEL